MSAFLRAPKKVDGIPTAWEREPAVERRRAQRLYYGGLRWQLAYEAVLRPWASRWPRPPLAALLLLAAYELGASDADRRPAILHHAVECAKQWLSVGESRMVNALLRRLLRQMDEGWVASAEAAHPAWLVKAWQESLGAEAASLLTEWNQQEPPVYARWDAHGAPPKRFQASPWEGYFQVSGPEDWEALRVALGAGHAYVQDPFARHPIELLAPRSGEVILDACAAPGGKTRALLAAARLKQVVAADLPGPRIKRLEANLNAYTGPTRVDVAGLDLSRPPQAALRSRDLPECFDGVILDAPCSNTGVIARRPDVRFHLSAEGIEGLSRLQLALLESCAGLVRPGGRIVYSTCSLERIENEGVVEAFLAKYREFSCEVRRLSRPWVDHHDGGGAFLLTRSGCEK